MHDHHHHLLSLDLMEGIHTRILMVLHLLITLVHMLATHTHIIIHITHLLHREVCLLLQPIMECMDMDHPLRCPLRLSTGDNTTLQSM